MLNLAHEYFLAKRPDSGSEKTLYMRIATSLCRLEISMTELCGMSEKELQKIRGIGVKACEIITKECQNYRNESSGTNNQ